MTSFVPSGCKGKVSLDYSCTVFQFVLHSVFVEQSVLTCADHVKPSIILFTIRATPTVVCDDSSGASHAADCMFQARRMNGFCLMGKLRKSHS